MGYISLLFILAGSGIFIYSGMSDYKINENFTSLPLKFDPYTSSSVCQIMNAQITVQEGFVKGVQKNQDGSESLVIRAISPLPALVVTGIQDTAISLLIENINPDFYAMNIANTKLPIFKVKVNTLRTNIAVKAGETIKVKPEEPNETGNTEKYKYIILGDNRGGYNTFGQIIQQANGQNPVFVIDNGDLVYSGKPNQYRLFDQMVSKLSTTLCTNLGNHDIRGDGRSIYTKLYGPAYYSFSFGNSHFVFLDSSPGWTDKRSISEEQYTWLEKDLAKSKGMSIYVITHIPPRDPRSNIKPNILPKYVDKIKKGQNWFEKKLDNYYENKIMAHCFQNPKEAQKFETLMTSYHVDTVYLSHIHSYFEYEWGGVRYLISGGAGAELLTENSYYHYMITTLGNADRITMVELPSPANTYADRFTATAELFAASLYEENPFAVILVLIGIGLLILLLIIKIYLWKRKPFNTLFRWLYDTGKYSAKHFKELFGKKSS
jgi:3',5'-cyclic AMP phosphodiesterase CpdA